MDVKSEIKRNSRDVGRFNISKYLGTTHKVYNVPVPKLKSIAASWVKDNKEIEDKKFIEFLDRLYIGQSREEKVLASMILGRLPKHLIAMDAIFIDRWLGKLEGWEEVDSMCDEIDVWLREDIHKRLNDLNHFNKDKQIEKRRASLVVLCNSVRHDDNKELAQLSFQFIDNLKGEKHAMITKAISWLLRALIKYHKDEVEKYLKANVSTLPKIAVREVTRKLETGKK